MQTENTLPMQRQGPRHANSYYVRLFAGQFLTYLAVIVGLLIFFVPVYYMISSSVKAESEIFALPIHWLPHEFTPENYPNAFDMAPFGLYFYNSVVVATVVVLSTLLFSALAGYGFAKFSFPGKNIAFLFVLSTLMVPFQVLLIPLYLLVYSLGWANNYAGLIVPGALSAFGVFLMRQFCQTLPDELLDAARIDGAGEIRIFWSLVLPLLMPPLASLAIITFLGSWNNFLWPLIVVNKDNLFTLPVGMSVFSQPLREPHWAYIMAVSTVATLPVILVFLLLQHSNC
jgi:multiple sugar transport system permease protein